MKRGVKAILFDMGGVLLELGTSQGLPEGPVDWRGRQALLNKLRAINPRLDLDDLDRLLFAPWREIYLQRYERGQEARWEPHFHRLRREAKVRGRTRDLLEVWFRPFAESLRPEKDAIDVLRTLHQTGIRLGLVSNVPLPGILYRRVLKRFGLEEPFDDFRFSYDEDTRKPSPMMIRAALTALQVTPSETWMVGDRKSSDVAAGRAAGVTTVWLKSEYSQGPTPDRTIRRLAELPQLLEPGG